ncbi:GNAT family N-acetyltransferase [Aureimonas mangrovi]|uniref:GNAT family N-acetyltransferase n=1 Tax=Aureimonas mangrovi TaxID=2758041 RepID=UPI00163DD41B|nr:GNAT family N-acetyltransferase [Aureimonas mangrovi]
MNRFFVRTAGPGDLKAISTLLTETWQATYDRIYGPDRVREINASWHGEDTLRPRLERPDSEFLVADDSVEIAGMAFAALPLASEGKARDCVFLHQLYVHPAHQRSGIGGDLFAEIESSFFEARRIRVEVEAANDGAIAFWRRVGFSPTAGEGEGSVLVMEKALAVD